MNSARTAFLGAIAALAFVVLLGQSTADRIGTDTAAVDLASQLKPEYQPWVKPVGLIPAPSHEKALFALQASCGAALFSFAVWRHRRKLPRDRS